jgi:predicted aspartyl protease
MLSASAAAEVQAKSALRSLYDAHKWVELRAALNKNAPDLYKGAVAVVFNEPQAERVLASVIKSAPYSDHAYEAHDWLIHLYLRSGAYRRLISHADDRWAAFPDKPEREQERTALAPFRGLPDQINGKRRQSILPHQNGEIFIPLMINGNPATYFFDTGGWLSCMSESEAKRLGLTIRETAGTLGTGTGARVGFRAAVASELIVGQIHFRDVSFAVFPDDQEPWSVLPVGHRGLLGIPILLGLRNLSWNRDGTVAIGMRSTRLDIPKSNLCFDDDHLAITAFFQDRKILASLDTGALTTDLYETFAKEFATLVSKSGKKDSTEVRGVGNEESFDSITVPDLTFAIGGTNVILRPAHVLLKQIGPKQFVGNFGMDLLKQTPGFKMDFAAMKLELEPAPSSIAAN